MTNEIENLVSALDDRFTTEEHVEEMISTAIDENNSDREDEIDYDELACNMDYSEIAGYVDADDIAMRIDTHDVASELDLSEIVQTIADNDDLAERLSKVLATKVTLPEIVIEAKTVEEPAKEDLDSLFGGEVTVEARVRRAMAEVFSELATALKQ